MSRTGRKKVETTTMTVMVPVAVHKGLKHYAAGELMTMSETITRVLISFLGLKAGDFYEEE